MSKSEIFETVEGMVGEDLHAKRILSLSNGVEGVMAAASLSVSAIGRGLAGLYHLEPKHAIKQVDRLLSNSALDVPKLQIQWARFVIGKRKALTMALDWTEFDQDGHSTIAVNLLTTHGRATPLVWRTVEKSKLKRCRNRYETELLELLHGAVPEGVEVTILADRGFGDQKRYAQIDGLGWYFVIRFRGGIAVADEKGEQMTANEWLHPSGRTRTLRNARVTDDQYPLGAVVVTKAKKMKEGWFLATNRSDTVGAQLVQLYGRRFTIEENFRDTKDPRFGLGLSATRVLSTDRRDRLLLLAAIAQVLLTLLGAAGEKVGLDRTLKANTSKKRQHSLYNQGLYWYHAIPGMLESRLRIIMRAFDQMVREHRVFRDVFGVI